MYPKHRYISNDVYRCLVDKRCSIVCDLDLENREGPDYPTQDQVIDWLEQEYKIFVYAFPLYNWTKNTHPVNVKQWGVSIKHNAIEKGCNNTYSSKQEAIDAGLVFILNVLIKDEIHKS